MSKKTICFISPYAYNYFNPGFNQSAGGAERQQFLLANELKSKKNEIAFIVFEGKQKGHEKINGIDIYKVLKDNHVKNTHYNMKVLYNTMKNIDANVYYTRGNEKLCIATSYICDILGKSHIYSIADDRNAQPEQGSIGRIKNYMFFKALAKSDMIISQTKKQKYLLKKNYNLNSTTIPNMYGVPNDDEVLNFNERDRVLWVGSLDKNQKKPHRFLNLAKQLPKIEFWLIGPDTKTDYSDSIVKKSRNINNLSYLGFVPPDEIDIYYQKASILVNTSDYEGFPNTFLEAWRYGTPVCSLHFSLDNVLVNENIGYLTGDMKSMETHIKKISSNRSLWSRLSKNSRNYFINNYSIEKVFPKYESVFQNI